MISLNFFDTDSWTDAVMSTVTYDVFSETVAHSSVVRYADICPSVRPSLRWSLTLNDL